MDFISNKEALSKPVFTANNPMSLPPQLLPTTKLTVPKPICSVKQTPAPSYPLFAKVTRGENVTKNCGYSKSLSGPHEKDNESIALEHCYARPLNWKPDSPFYQPTKVLFMSQPFYKKKFNNPLAPQHDFDEVVDVEFITPGATELYDKTKAYTLMEECDRHFEFTKAYQTNDDWEESIPKTNWTTPQLRLFDGMARILNNDQLARLTHAGSHHEPIKRRIVIDKSVKRVRQLFASISWDIRLTQWLHQLLLDHLSAPYLSAYSDILQTLKAKVPSLLDKIMFGSQFSSRIGPTSLENMFQLLKRPWDPYGSYLSHNKPRKLNGNPVIIIVPCAPSTTNVAHFKRQHTWMNLFANLSTVVAVHTNIGSNANRLTLVNCADQMLTATRAKVQEVKVDYSGRKIILVGFNAGAALALQVAQVESVFCVICMGFSVLTAEGRRGEPDDSLLELQCPVLFVIGQCSNTSSWEDIEDLRERMRVENGLVVVGSADDYLRINKKKKKAEGVTQIAVDSLIIEAVGEFINGLMISPYPPQVRQSPTQTANEFLGSKSTKMERIRNISNGSSLESEPPSPTPKVTRPVGRPPGSKSKNKLEAKWAAQVTQGILPTPTPPHPLTQPTSKPPTLLPFQSGTTTISSSTINTPTTTIGAGLENSDKTKSGNTLSNIVTTSNKMPLLTTAKRPSGIKILENVNFKAATNGKFVPGAKQNIDLSKITILNSANATASGASSNIVLMPDGKLKTISSTIKGTGSTPLLVPLSNKNKPTISQMPHTVKYGVGKYITSKKQLLGRRPPYFPQKPSTITSFASSLPPPTNLTSQDIMDLPIIFADDNQMLTDNSELRQADVPVPEIIQPTPATRLPLSNPVGKFVFLNKQRPLLQPLSAPALKRPTLSVPVRTTANPVKYTKIIISRGLKPETKPALAPTTNIQKISHLSPELSIKRIERTSPSLLNSSEPMDLENKLVATAIPKPEYTITIKKEQDYDSALAKSMEIIKRNASNFANIKDDDDPDYIPPKSALLK